MKSRAKALLLLILVPVLSGLFASCATKKVPGFSAPNALLRGMVYNEDRLPVQDVEVKLMAGGEVLQSTRSDVRGHYFLGDVAFGVTRLEFAKDGYEPFSWEFSFDSPTQVVYVRMTNMNELLDDAANAIAKRDWDIAVALLDRADKMKAEDAIGLFLRAELLDRRGEPDKAVEILEKLSASGSPSFAVELALADIYQDELKAVDKALLHLKMALSIKEDVEVEKRIELLQVR